MTLEVKRVEMRMRERNPYENQFNEWFSRIHFLYCSAWAIIFTLLFILALGDRVFCGESSRKLPFLFLGCLLLFIAFLEDIHAMKVEKRTLDDLREKDNCKLRSNT